MPGTPLGDSSIVTLPQGDLCVPSLECQVKNLFIVGLVQLCYPVYNTSDDCSQPVFKYKSLDFPFSSIWAKVIL